MFFEKEADLITTLYVATALLLFMVITAGIIAIQHFLKVREFQDLLHKADRKIDQLERRMFHVLNAVPVALVETDISGKFTFANKSAHSLLGRKDAELLGLRFHSATWGITYPDGRMIPSDLMPIARTLRGQTVKGFQHLMAHPQTRAKMLVSVTSMPITNSNGEVIGTTTAIVELEAESGEGVGDITGIWRGQWFARSPVPFWGLDTSGTIIDVNPAACLALGVAREACLGKNWAEAFVDEQDLLTAHTYVTACEKGTGAKDSIFECELRLKTPVSGTTSYEKNFCISAWKVETQDGTAEGLTVMAHPITSHDTVTLLNAQPDELMPEVLWQDRFQDLQQAEKVREALSIGVWYYDEASDSIVEDAGMRRLIGRLEPGGPTLISAQDQMRADEAFSRLRLGEISQLELEINVDDPGGARLILLKGMSEAQSEIRDETKAIFGAAYDITAIKHVAQKEECLSPDNTQKQDEMYDWQTAAAPDAALQDALAVARQDAQAAKAEQKTLMARYTSELERLKEELATTRLQQRQQDDQQQRLEDALIMAQRFETVGRLTGHVAHDFQQMLSVMNDALEIMQKQSDKPDHIRRLSQAALIAGKRGERLTRQLQAFSRAEDI
jgi:PAS domain S-box-containing protein